MRKLIAVVLLAGMASSAVAQSVNVRGYVRRDGTYVAPHVRTTPNSSTLDNWSTAPNVNPYNGRQGTRSPLPQIRPVTPPPVYRPYSPR